MLSVKTSFWKNISRRKTLTSDNFRSDLKRCLGLSDLTFLAIGSMVGSGIYVLTGTIAQNVAGPSVIISYVIAAIASGLSAVCYAEFGARVPITGSAYQFTYLSIGELWAFLIGWNVLIEHIVTASAVAKSWSGYLDAAMGNPVKNYLIEHCPMIGGGVIPEYPDLLAVAILIFATLVLIFGAQMSSTVTTFFAGLNLVVICIVVGSGLYLGNIQNWTEVKGGFFPFGVSGALSGAATLVFSYVGYEVIASTTEESIRPNRDVPLSLFIALSVTAITYVGASVALTLMVPYYDISVLAPFPEAFKIYGWTWTRYLVTVGALAAMITSMLTALYIVPRYLMAMSKDGLLVKFFSLVTKSTQIPYVSVILSGVSCIFFAIIFELQVLVEFISIGQLLACTFVSICVVKLRYEPNEISKYMELIDATDDTRQTSNTENSKLKEHFTTTEINYSPITSNTKQMKMPSMAHSSTSSVTSSEDQNPPKHVVGTVKNEILKSAYGFLFIWTTNYTPGVIPVRIIIAATSFLTVAAGLLVFSGGIIPSWWTILLISIFGLATIICLTSLLAFHQDETIRTFKVPGVPYLPFLSIFINILLMLKLQPTTWVRLGIWVSAGLAVYFGYGYSHSVERRKKDGTLTD